MRIAILTVPYDAGQRSVGVGLGPAKLLDAGLANQLREQGHDVREVMVELPLDAPAGEFPRTIAIQRQLNRTIQNALTLDEFPVVLAGNCSTAVGTLAARPGKAAVLWFDAHGDFNTPDTTLTGMLDGMALAMATGRCFTDEIATVPGFRPVDERRVLLIGARDLDPAEKDALDASAVQRLAATTAPREIVARLRGLDEPTPPVYVHLDLDVLEPTLARANRFAAPGGFTPHALVAALEAVSGTAPIFAVAITAYDPAYDLDGSARLAALRALTAIVPQPERAD